MRVLLVEDEKPLAAALGKIFERIKYWLMLSMMG